MKTCCFLLLLLSLAACKQEMSLPPLVTDTIKNVANKYAPDKRTAIYDIQAVIQGSSLVLKGETSNIEAKTELLQSLKSLSPIDSIQLLPNASLASKLWGVITIPVANMRSKPAHSSELANQILCGTVLRLYKIQSGWVYCQTPDEYLGWVDLDAVARMDSMALEEWWTKPKVIVTSMQANISELPSKQSPPISMVPAGAILESGLDSKNYYAVAFSDGRTGYLPSDQGADFGLWKIKQSKTPASESILRTAFTFKGTSYLWGGTTAHGVDCSGFTKMVFMLNGLLLPRDASQQVKVGKPIETDTTLINILPGDLLFFGKKMSDTTAEKITHVAIYTGNGKIIHSSGYVRMQSLRRGDPDFAENRLASLVRATRPLSAPGAHGIPSIADLKYYK